MAAVSDFRALGITLTPAPIFCECSDDLGDGSSFLGDPRSREFDSHGRDRRARLLSTASLSQFLASISTPDPLGWSDLDRILDRNGARLHTLAVSQSWCPHRGGLDAPAHAWTGLGDPTTHDRTTGVFYNSRAVLFWDRVDLAHLHALCRYRLYGLPEAGLGPISTFLWTADIWAVACERHSGVRYYPSRIVALPTAGSTALSYISGDAAVSGLFFIHDVHYLSKVTRKVRLNKIFSLSLLLITTVSLMTPVQAHADDDFFSRTKSFLQSASGRKESNKEDKDHEDEKRDDDEKRNHKRHGRSPHFDTTIIAGTIYDSSNARVNGDKDFERVTVTCNGVVKTGDIGSNGGYTVTFRSNQCKEGDSVTTSAVTESGSGSNTTRVYGDDEEGPCGDTDVTVLDVSVPEFGLIGGIFTALASVGGYLKLRKRQN